jgi:hypothetical protein
MASVRYVAALLLASASWVFSGGVLLAGLVWGASLRCDESCGGGEWRRTMDAWQWDGVVALGAIAFLAGTALLFFVWWGRRWLAALAYLVGLGAVLTLAFALSPSWPDHFGEQADETLLLLAGFLAPIAAVILTEPRRRQNLPSS